MNDAMTARESGRKIFWVGIGASAGGLEALRDLVRNLSPGIGAIYVVLQHMSPQHKSLLTELIGRETELKVAEITDGVVPNADNVYIAPPNHDVIVQGGRLRLLAPSTELAAPKPSVDRFFRSLAETLGDRAIGIVLSGTGSDGAYGVRAIRAAGGVTIAQSKSTAKYDGMPHSAVETGCIDLVLSPQEIGVRFDRIIRMPRNLDGIVDDPPMDTLSELFKTMRDHTGVDFREYKPSTVRRRIERRMAAIEVGNLAAYSDYVAENPTEIDALFKDMMISVTSFYRDPAEFEHLKAAVKEHLNAEDKTSLRVWIPGCATGEEAYSLAFLIVDYLGGIKALDEVELKIFATDIDTNALSTARKGFYPATISADVPPKVLQTYFTESHDGYQVTQAIRDRIVFTPHNLCQDPPFSNIDLVSCRNLLIYFAASLQAKVFVRLHYALKPGGILFLGKSESISGSESLFKPTSSAGQVYIRRSYVENRPIAPTPNLAVGRLSFGRRQTSRAERSEGDGYGQMFHALVRAIGPNGLLVTPDMHIQRVYGNVNRYLSLPEGQMRGATVSMLREELRQELRTLIPLAMRNAETRTGMEQSVSEDGQEKVQVIVHPVGLDATSDDFALVIFREWKEEPRQTPVLPIDDEAAVARIDELENEVIGMRESLQQTSEELETANEELQALNEELQSVNEELQSTNEELETANEELQSTNEELITVNEELQINSHEMSVINQELDSILSNIAAPVMVVDARLHIVQCSQSARSMFKIETGVAKPHLSQLSLPGEFPPLTSLMASVIHTGQPAEREIDTREFRGLVVAAPYFNPKGELIGATAIVHEVSDPRYRDMEVLINGLSSMIWQVGSDGTLAYANAATAEFLGQDTSEIIGRHSDTLFEESGEAYQKAQAAAIEHGTAQFDVCGEVKLTDGPQVSLTRQLIPYRHDDGTSGIFVVANKVAAPGAFTPEVPAQPVTDHVVDWRLGYDDTVYLAPAAAKLLKIDVSSGGLSRSTLIAALHSDDRTALKHGIDTVLDQAVPFSLKVRLKGSARKDAQLVISGSAERDSAGDVTAVVGKIAAVKNSRRRQAAKPKAV